VALDTDDFRRVMGFFATGVTVVTTALGDRLHGMTANAFCSVSLDPSLVLVCIERRSQTHSLLARSGVFAVNILSEDQEELSRLFAISNPPESEPFSSVRYRLGVTGAPILEDCLAYAECRVAASYPGGDHTVFLGHVKDLGVLREARPLLYYRSAYKSLPSHGDPGPR
jgi:flavin reductase (DIM6/NTAB) family NADH-FMN oxidoreductase RutF